jgi:hypothetical protein
LCCVGHPESDMLIDLEYPNVDFEPWAWELKEAEEMLFLLAPI